ncbi:unnamed protein product [Brassica oleracea var. botrytis]|uniref:Uncharacterized protein n=2 Tax=Brassica oleracea TaxID=3712 RepID=A0A0D3A8F1_BRAOL|nr:unnamed protein product [Brassica oleracea]
MEQAAEKNAALSEESGGEQRSKDPFVDTEKSCILHWKTLGKGFVTVSVRQIKRSALMSWTDGYTSSRRQDIKELKTALEEAKKRLHVTG